MKDQKFTENSNDMDYSMDPHEFVKARTEGGSSVGIINSTSLQQTSSSLERLNFDEGMQLADFGQRFGLNQLRNNEEHSSIDPTFFPQFPIITPSISMPIPIENDVERFDVRNTNSKLTLIEVENEDCGVADNNSLKRNNIEIKGKRKRPRSSKTTEEVENQRMTHIAVERNRRKQMNEHLKVLRSLMPCSYVQRGDQASIIGGAIEFVRELEQLLQCLESQKRRRFLEEAPRPYDNSFPLSLLQFQTPFLPSSSLPNDNIRLFDCDNSFQEEFAEKRSPLADIEVKLVGFEATIKILSQRKHGQLLKTIAALEDLQFDILHLNITTIDQTVLYSFNIKLSHESRFRAEEIANSVQQIFNYIHIRITGGKLGKPLWKRTIYVGSLHV